MIRRPCWNGWGYAGSNGETLDSVGLRYGLGGLSVAL